MMSRAGERTGRIFNRVSGSVEPGRIVWDAQGVIIALEKLSTELNEEHPLITPPLVNAHVHVESSMVVPSRFGAAMLASGVGAAISDPHEIANVLGRPGIDFMLDDQRSTPMQILFGAPSCVPATNNTIETAGSELDAIAVGELLHDERIHYLAEVMNFPGVIAGDRELLKKIAAAQEAGKPVDGHAPGLRGEALAKYVAAGISTDHECTSLDEAHEKIERGMKILIREGSAAKNFDALASLICTHSDSVMLCSDDLHPDDFESLNINSLCARALERGASLAQVLRAAVFNARAHYQIPIGDLTVGASADMVLWEHGSFRDPQETILRGTTVFSAKKQAVALNSLPAPLPNRFRKSRVSVEQLIASHQLARLPTIRALDGQIITARGDRSPHVEGYTAHSSTQVDVVKLVVVNRYDNQATPAICFVEGTGLKRGALASSVAHDCHNIVACGVDDKSIVRAVNMIIDAGGGVSCVTGGQERDVAELLPLPVAGLMSDLSVEEVGPRYRALTRMAKQECGCSLSAPFMTLSFLALPVIPSLKLTDKGLFDVDAFAFCAVAGT